MVVAPPDRCMGRFREASEHCRDWRCKRRERLASQEVFLAPGLSRWEDKSKPQDRTTMTAERGGGRDWAKGKGDAGRNQNEAQVAKHRCQPWQGQEVKSRNLELLRIYWRKRAGQIFKEGAMWSGCQERNVILVLVQPMRPWGHQRPPGRRGAFRVPDRLSAEFEKHPGERGRVQNRTQCRFIWAKHLLC